MLLVNGHKTDHISFYDRGFQYGDGLFETIAVLDGKPVFLSQHLQRLHSGCVKLSIPNLNIRQLQDEIENICKDKPSAVIKVIVTRGIGGRGYRIPDTVQPTRTVGLFPYPDYPDNFISEGIAAIFCRTRLGLNPSLAGIKHLNRLEQIMARAEWSSPSISEGIMCDMNNHVIEGTMTNLFYVKNSKFYTASLAFSGIAGITRTIILKLLSEKKIDVIEHQYGRETLLDADEVFFCNSIIGIWPVKKIDHVDFKPGRFTKQMQQWLAAAKTSKNFL